MSAQGWQRPRGSKRRTSQADTNAISIVAIVKYFGGQTKEGKAAPVKCSLHNDSRASAVMNSYDNLFYCHTCGFGGNAVTYVMHKEGLEFKDALKRALEIAAGSGDSLRRSNRRPHLKVLKRSWDI